MKVKNFKLYLGQRLDKDEIAEIEQAAQAEYETLCKVLCA